MQHRISLSILALLACVNLTNCSWFIPPEKNAPRYNTVVGEVRRPQLNALNPIATAPVDGYASESAAVAPPMMPAAEPVGAPQEMAEPAIQSRPLAPVGQSADMPVARMVPIENAAQNPDVINRYPAINAPAMMSPEQESAERLARIRAQLEQERNEAAQQREQRVQAAPAPIRPMAYAPMPSVNAPVVQPMAAAPLPAPVQMAAIAPRTVVTASPPAYQPLPPARQYAPQIITASPAPVVSAPAPSVSLPPSALTQPQNYVPRVISAPAPPTASVPAPTVSVAPSQAASPTVIAPAPQIASTPSEPTSALPSVEALSTPEPVAPRPRRLPSTETNLRQPMQTASLEPIVLRPPQATVSDSAYGSSSYEPPVKQATVGSFDPMAGAEQAASSKPSSYLPQSRYFQQRAY